MAAIREKVISLAGAGVSQVIIAEACGVTPSYVSQLLEEDAVRSEVAKLRSQRVEAAITHDDSLDSAEKKALSRMVSQLPFMKPNETINAFRAVNAAKRQSESGKLGEQAPIQADLVTIVLPKAAKIFMQVNSENQAVSIDGTTMAPLPSRALPALAQRLSPHPENQTVIDVPPEQQKLIERREARDLQRSSDLLENLKKDLTVVVGGQTLEI